MPLALAAHGRAGGRDGVALPGVQAGLESSEYDMDDSFMADDDEVDYTEGTPALTGGATGSGAWGGAGVSTGGGGSDGRGKSRTLRRRRRAAARDAAGARGAVLRKAWSGAPGSAGPSPDAGSLVDLTQAPSRGRDGRGGEEESGATDPIGVDAFAFRKDAVAGVGRRMRRAVDSPHGSEEPSFPVPSPRLAAGSVRRDYAPDAQLQSQDGGRGDQREAGRGTGPRDASPGGGATAGGSGSVAGLGSLRMESPESGTPTMDSVGCGSTSSGLREASGSGVEQRAEGRGVSKRIRDEEGGAGDAAVDAKAGTDAVKRLRGSSEGPGASPDVSPDAIRGRSGGPDRGASSGPDVGVSGPASSHAHAGAPAASAAADAPTAAPRAVLGKAAMRRALAQEVRRQAVLLIMLETVT